MNKSKKLLELLNSDELVFAMESHSGLSAVIVEEAGFNGIWASGLSMSASTGCRDRNELSIDEVCKICEYMADHTNLPILVDGDTGGVDFNSARIMVNKLNKAGAAGVCIEDKLYPKQNSFLNNTASDLADPDTHAGKIRAMKDENPDFVVVARLESFIAGSDLSDAYNRALIYQNAGADAILVHSKKSTSEDIDKFMDLWNKDKDNGCNRVPIVIVPTKYYTTPTDHFRDIGISLVIWANHNLRASIKAMQDVSRKIHDDESLYSIEDGIATVKEVFRLQRDSELTELEKIYAPNHNKNVSAIILAGGNIPGTEIPKCSVKILGKSLLNYQIDSMDNSGISDITSVISQDWKDTLSQSCNYLYNNSPTSAKELSSVNIANENGINLSNTIISFGDLFFKKGIIRDLINSKFDITVAISSSYLSRNFSYTEYMINDNFGTKIVDNSELDPDNMDIIGSVVGMIKINKSTANEDIKKFFNIDRNNVYFGRLKDLINYLISLGYTISTVSIDKSNWVDVNELSDIAQVSDMIGG